jgi:hypothetical protein
MDARYRYIYEPGTTFYRSPPARPLSRRNKRALKRLLAKAEAYRRERFPEYYRDKD